MLNSLSLPPLSKNQNTAIDWALERKGSAWFMPPGMGKTRSWLELIKETDEPTLVVAPKLVCLDVWPRENKKWGYHFGMRFLHGKEKNLRRLPQLTLINYDGLPWLSEQLKRERILPFKQVIFDEVSKMKNPETKRVESYLEWAGRLAYRNGGTGTPVGASPMDLFGEMLVCDGGRSLGQDFYKFRRTYFDKNEWSNQYEIYSDALEEILDRIAPRAISFDINDLEMPPLKSIPHYLELPADARAAYEEMHEEGAHEELELLAVNAAVKSSKLRQMTGGGVIDIHGARKKLHNAKAEHLKEILQEHNGRPVMVFFEFLSDFQTICDVLKYTPPALYGKTKAKDAAKIIKRWNEGKVPVLALHPRSAAYGLNLQDSGHVIVWYTLSWSFEMVNQGIARLWRQGQKNKVLVYYLLVEGTEDERVYERVGEREETHNAVMKGLL